MQGLRATSDISAEGLQREEARQVRQENIKQSKSYQNGSLIISRGLSMYRIKDPICKDGDDCGNPSLTRTAHESIHSQRAVSMGVIRWLQEHCHTPLVRHVHRSTFYQGHVANEVLDASADANNVTFDRLQVDAKHNFRKCYFRRAFPR